MIGYLEFFSLFPLLDHDDIPNTNDKLNGEVSAIAHIEELSKGYNITEKTGRKGTL